MSSLYLIRHGQASFGSDNYDQLSTLGHKQSRWLGDHLAAHDDRFDCLFTGSLVRHHETADGIKQGLTYELPSVEDARLNEFNFIEICAAYLEQFPDEAPNQDAQRHEFYRVLRAAMTAWAEGRLDAHVGESWASFQQRATDFTEEMKSSYVGQRVLVVSSGGIIASIVGQALSVPHQHIIELNLQVKNTSINQCFFSTKRHRLHSFNTVPHLDVSDRKDSITYS